MAERKVFTEHDEVPRTLPERKDCDYCNGRGLIWFHDYSWIRPALIKCLYCYDPAKTLGG